MRFRCELHGNLNGPLVNNQVMVERTEANRQKFSSKIKAPSGLKSLSGPIAARIRHVCAPKYANQQNGAL